MNQIGTNITSRSHEHLTTTDFPIPSSEEVVRFQDLYARRFGLLLDTETARKKCSDLYIFVFLTERKDEVLLVRPEKL